MKTEHYINLGQLAALISFLLGTIIFGLYFMTSSFNLLFVGYGFIAIVGLINVCIIIPVLTRATNDKVNKSKLNWTAALMLLNIPVMLTYCWVAVILLNTMRITVTNSTQTVLEDITIVGCETEYIDKLEIGKSKTVWVTITGDCAIDIHFLTNGQPKMENVAGYVTNNMGQKMKYNIGGRNDDLF